MSRMQRFQWLSSLWGYSRRPQLLTTRPSEVHYSCYRRRLNVESLEDRRMLSITVNTLVDELDGSIGDGDISLRDAIVLASSGETIDFDTALDGGTILMSLGEMAITDALTIDAGTLASGLTIDADSSSQIFNISDGAVTIIDVEIRGLTLTGGVASVSGRGGAISSRENLTIVDSTITGNSATLRGGGIFATGPVTITDSTISDNSADLGGGLFVNNTTTISGSTILGNSASADGGGIRTNVGTTTITDSTFSGNTAVNHGGGIWAYRETTITDSTISGNSAGIDGGGIWTKSATTINGSIVSDNLADSTGGGIDSTGNLTIVDTTFSGNSVVLGSGGGIYARAPLTVTSSSFLDNTADSFDGGGIWAGASTSISGSTFSGNSAGDGGGLFQTFGDLNISESTFSENSAGGDGGGLRAGGGLKLTDSTISGNNGGGIWSNNAVEISGSIVAGNGGGFGPDLRPDTDALTVNHSLIGDNQGTGLTEAQTPDASGNLIGSAAGGGIINPLLGALADNGGPTLTLALRPGSPAVDMGDPSAVAGVEGVPLYDQRGFGFSRVVDGRIDMGAVEGAIEGPIGPPIAPNISLVGNLNPLGVTSYSDVWGEGDYAYLGTFGESSGVAIIDISDPTAPFLAAHYNPGGEFRDPKVQAGIGYFSGESRATHIVDLSDPTNPILLSTVPQSHNIYIEGDYLYTSSGQIWNVSDPTTPFEQWRFSGGHDITVVNDRLYVSRFGGTTLIYDVSNLANEAPTLLTSFSSGPNSHSNWPTADGNFLVSAREIGSGDVRIFDISDLDNVQLVSTITGSSVGAGSITPHNPLLVGDLLFVSWYDAGLQVFDISDRADPVRVDSFGGIGSNWGVYPLSGLDRVLLSSQSNGLFIVDASSFAMVASAQSPAEGEAVATPPTDFVIDFSNLYDPATVAASDLTVNGIAADSFTLTDADTVTFHYTASPALQGIVTMHMAAGAVQAAPVAGIPASLGALSDFSSSFRYDAVVLEVVSTDPAAGSLVELPHTSWQFDFNEPFDSATVSTDDLLLSQGSVTGFNLIDADSIVFTIEGLVEDGTLTAEIPAGALTDLFGNPNLAYLASYELDVVTAPYPVPLVPKAPLGSLIYDPSLLGAISFAGDTDSYTLDVDPGQTITVVVETDANLQASVKLLARATGHKVVASGAASALGENVVLQTVATRGKLANNGPPPQTYRIVVEGDHHTVGNYSVQIILNAAVEAEQYGGPINDTLATAQDLTPSFLPLNSAIDDSSYLGWWSNYRRWWRRLLHRDAVDDGPARGAVLGSGASPVSQWATTVIDFSSQYSTTSWSAAQTLGEPDTFAYGDSVTAWSPIPENGTTEFIALGFDTPVIATGVTIRETLGNGFVTQVDVLDLEGNPHTVWSGIDPSLPDSPADFRIDVIPTAFEVNGVVIHIDTDHDMSTWEEIDAVQLHGVLANSFIGGPEDFYSFTLDAGSSATLALTSLTGNSLELELIDSAGAPLALATPGSTNVDEVIRNFVAPATGTYFARVNGFGDYSLVVMRNTEFDIEPNDDMDAAQPIVSPRVAGRQWVLGSLSSEDAASEAAPLSLGIDLFDGDGFRWDIQQDGTIRDGTSDAYDGGLRLSGFPEFSGGQAEEEGREIVIGPATDSGVEVTRKIFVPADQGYARYLEIVTNTTDSPLLHTVLLSTKLGSDFSTVIVGTSSGDDFFTTDDNWIVTDDSSDGGGDPTMLHVIAGAGGRRPTTVSHFDNDDFLYSYDLLLAPGETQIVMHFASQNANRAAALAKGLELAKLELDALAGMTLAERVAVVNFQPGSLSDFYQIETSKARTIKIATGTPASKAGEPINPLDPLVRLYDSSGNLLAADDNSAPDGRNARLKYRVPDSGIYFIEVTEADSTGGEYLLEVKGADGGLPAFAVTATDPPDGSRLVDVPSQLTVDFNDGFLLTSLQATDLTVDGNPAVGLTVVDGNTVIFDLPVLLEGTHAVTIAAGAILDLQGTPIDALSSELTIDQTAPRIVASSLQQGDVLPAGSLIYTAQFDEKLDATDLDADDVMLHGLVRDLFYAPESFSYDAISSTLTVEYANLLEDNYQLTLLSGDGAFENLVGFNLDGEPVAFPLPPNTSGDGLEGGDFVVNFELEVVTMRYPMQLVPKLPLGSLIYDPSLLGFISFVGDTDDYTLAVDANQTITLLVEPVAGLQPTVELFDPSNTPLGAAAAAAAGQHAVLQTVATAGAGTYTFSVGGAAGTLGNYHVQVILNAAVEDEKYIGATNDSLAAAQDLAASFLSLGTGSAARGAVLGTTDPPVEIVFSESLLSSPVQFPNVLNLDFNGVPLGVGPGTLSLQVFADLGDPSEFLTIEAEGIPLSDVFVYDGTDFSNVTTTINLTSAQMSTLAADGTVSFTITPSADVGGGFSFLTTDLEVEGIGGDFYRFELDDGQSATVALTALRGDGIGLGLELLDSAGALLATGVAGASNVDLAISNFVDQTSDAAADNYFLRIFGPEIDYSLIVTRDATFDLEPNDDEDTAQDISISGTVLGHLSSAVDASDETPIALGIDLFDGDGFLWDIAQNGRIIGDDGRGDAYDGGLRLSGFPEFSGGQAEEEGREIVIGPATGSGIEVTRKIFVPADQGYARFLEIVTNTTASPLLHTVSLSTNLGSDSGTVIVGTSSGDDSFTTDDNWIVTDDSSDGGGDPTMLHVIAGAGAQRPTTVSRSGDDLFYSYDLSLAPGETQIVMHYASQNANRAAALAKGPELAKLELDALTGMTSAERAAVVNFLPGSLVDEYLVAVGVGDALTITTTTPADGPGEFGNELDPHIELYDPSGMLVATGVALADGRNEQIMHTALLAGDYRIRVTSENDTRGEYVLDVDSTAPPAAIASADFNRDGAVDGFDFLAWQRGFGTPASNVARAGGDADNDLAVWETQFGSVTASAISGSLVETFAAGASVAPSKAWERGMRCNLQI